MTVPDRWNGTLLLYCRGLPLPPDELPWNVEEPLFQALTQEGYAIAGSGGSMFWPLEQAFQNQAKILEDFPRLVSEPSRTIAWGYSIGGIIAAGLVERMPGQLSGALPLCGNLAGAVAIHNRELDIAFVVKTLLADERLQIARIHDPRANLVLAADLLEAAQTNALGRARLALAAAVGNIPGWFDPRTRKPDPEDYAARQRNQFDWYREPVFQVLFFLRRQVERQAGGNPSWNTGVDYSALLHKSTNRDEVDALYAAADFDLQADLAALEQAPRIEPDSSAVAYLERHIVFSGELRGTPVLALHTDGDGLVTPDNEQAYADVVASAGQTDLLRQAWIHRGGHCSFSVAEVLSALSYLASRVKRGSWEPLDPVQLNEAAAARDPAQHVLIRDATPAAPAFADFEPWSFPRPYDRRAVEPGG